MKNIIISILIAGISFGPVMAYAQKASDSKQELRFHAGRYDPNGELLSVTAKGLVCEFCAKALEKVLLRRKEVSGVNVNLTTKEILISLKEGRSLDDATVEKLIKDAGYNMGKIKREQAK